MTFSESFSLSLGGSQTGLTLAAALVGSGGAIDGTKRDITTGFTEIGSGNYQWVYTDFSDGFRGSVVFYVGAIGEDSDFSGVTVKASSAPVNVPSAEEVRQEMDSNSTQLAVAAAGAAGTVGVTDNEDGTLTLSFKGADGTTEVANVTYTTETGARTRNS